MTDSVRRRDEAPRSFAVFLTEIEGGALNDQLSAELQGLVAAMRDHLAAFGGKTVKGSLTLKLDFTLDRRLTEVVATIKTKAPEAKRDRALFWATEGDNLSPENPDQFALPGIRSVPPAGEVRSA